MRPVPDRKKQRREYLKKKGKAYSALSLLSFVSLFMFLVMLFCGLLGFAFLGNAFNMRLAPAILCSVVSFGVVAAAAYARKGIQRDIEHTIHDLAKTRFVPPVTADTLPAEEVLVRGAEAPTATRETLLRPIRATQEAKTEELLRSIQE